MASFALRFMMVAGSVAGIVAGAGHSILERHVAAVVNPLHYLGSEGPFAGIVTADGGCQVGLRSSTFHPGDVVAWLANSSIDGTPAVSGNFTVVRIADGRAEGFGDRHIDRAHPRPQGYLPSCVTISGDAPSGRYHIEREADIYTEDGHHIHAVYPPVGPFEVMTP